MKYEIKNRCDNACVVWSGEIEDQGIDSKNLGAAVKKAVAEKASMLSANLRSANLRSANLHSADLRSADLRSADLDNDAKIARLDVCVWPVTIQDTGIEIGCKTYDHASIMGMTEERAAQEHPDAAIRWRRWGKVLQALVVATLGEVAEIGST